MGKYFTENIIYPAKQKVALALTACIYELLGEWLNSPVFFTTNKAINLPTTNKTTPPITKPIGRLL